MRDRIGRGSRTGGWVRDDSGQAAVASVVLTMILVLIAGGMVDVYRLQEGRNWAYRAAEAAALAGATLGRDLAPVYDPAIGRPRVDPMTGRSRAEDVLLESLNRRGVSGASYQIEVLEWGGAIAGFPPVARADMWAASDWVSNEPAVGVYLEIPVETWLLGLVNGGDAVTVHVFAAAAVAEG